MLALLAGLLGIAGVALLVVGTAEVARDDPPPRERRAAAAKPAATAGADPPAAAPVRVPAAIRSAIATMSRAEQVAQLFLVGFDGADASAFVPLRERGWGGLMITTDNAAAPEQVPGLAGEAAAGDAVRPLVTVVRVPGYEPPPQSPGDAVAGAREAARGLAQGWRAAGINLVFAPSADVGIVDGDGSFGDDPKRVARLADAAVRGWRAGGVIPAPGRFPGEGAASQDPLEGPSSVGLTRGELAARDLVPWQRLARSAPALVVSSAAFAGYDPVTPAALTPDLVQGLLREQLGFTGVAVSDELAGVTAATGGSIGDAAVDALRAGVDMVQISDPAEVEAAYRQVLVAKIPAARLREALVRVLTLKRGAGLLGPPAAQ